MHAQRRSSHRMVPVLAALVVAVLATQAQAQPSASASIGGSLDAFTSAGTVAERRENLLGTVNFDHLFANRRGRAAYDLDAGEYDSPGDWSYLMHRASLTYRFGGDEAGDRKLFLNASASARANGDAWTNAAYASVGGGLNVEVHPGQANTLRSGYRADYRRFADYSALTQLEQRAFVSLLHNAPSRTTLIAEIQAGLKHYDGTITTVTELNPSVAPAPVQAGNGGRGMGPGIRTIAWPVHSTSSTAAQGSAGLVSGLGRIAQSLTDRVGVYGQIQLRRTFGTAPPALVTTPAGFFEDGIYDDPFASDATLAQAGVKRSFANGAEVSLSGTWTDKDYTGSVALDGVGQALAGSPLRADRVRTALASWSHPLFPSRTGKVALDADVGYRFVRHTSNDAFYNYTSHALVLGLTVGY